MAQPIPKALNASINLSMIDKNHIIEGKNGKYLPVRFVNTPDSPYGNDYMIVQDIPKELRDQGLKGPVLGNGRAFDAQAGQQAQKQAPAGNTAQPSATTTADDLPF